MKAAEYEKLLKKLNITGNRTLEEVYELLDTQNNKYLDRKDDEMVDAIGEAMDYVEKQQKLIGNGITIESEENTEAVQKDYTDLKGSNKPKTADPIGIGDVVQSTAGTASTVSQNANSQGITGKTLWFTSSTGNATIDNLFVQATDCLKYEEWNKVDRILDNVILTEPRNASIFLTKAMETFRIRKIEDLETVEQKKLKENVNIQKALDFGTPEQKKDIQKRIDDSNSFQIYKENYRVFQAGNDSDELFKAAGNFDRISGYKDAKDMANQCQNLAKGIIYQKAEDTWKKGEQGNVDSYFVAIDCYERVGDYKDAKGKVERSIKNIYQAALKIYERETSSGYSLEVASNWFHRISLRKDNGELADRCKELAEKCKKSAIEKKEKEERERSVDFERDSLNKLINDYENEKRESENYYRNLCKRGEYLINSEVSSKARDYLEKIEGVEATYPELLGVISEAKKKEIRNWPDIVKKENRKLCMKEICINWLSVPILVVLSLVVLSFGIIVPVTYGGDCAELEGMQLYFPVTPFFTKSIAAYESTSPYIFSLGRVSSLEVWGCDNTNRFILPFKDKDFTMKLQGYDTENVDIMDIPKGTKGVVLNRYQLKELRLPDSLESLEIGNSKIDTMDIPVGIKTVILKDYQAKELDIPMGTKTVVLERCQAKELRLPDSLESLQVIGSEVGTILMSDQAKSNLTVEFERMSTESCESLIKQTNASKYIMSVHDIDIDVPAGITDVIYYAGSDELNLPDGVKTLEFVEGGNTDKINMTEEAASKLTVYVEEDSSMSGEQRDAIPANATIIERKRKAQE